MYDTLIVEVTPVNSHGLYILRKKTTSDRRIKQRSEVIGLKCLTNSKHQQILAQSN